MVAAAAEGSDGPAIARFSAGAVGELSGVVSTLVDWLGASTWRLEAGPRPLHHATPNRIATMVTKIEIPDGDFLSGSIRSIG